MRLYLRAEAISVFAVRVLLILYTMLLGIEINIHNVIESQHVHFLPRLLMLCKLAASRAAVMDIYLFVRIYGCCTSFCSIVQMYWYVFIMAMIHITFTPAITIIVVKVWCKNFSGVKLSFNIPNYPLLPPLPSPLFTMSLAETQSSCPSHLGKNSSTSLTANWALSTKNDFPFFLKIPLNVHYNLAYSSSCPHQNKASLVSHNALISAGRVIEATKGSRSAKFSTKTADKIISLIKH